jgi:hypothetical protein
MAIAAKIGEVYSARRAVDYEDVISVQAMCLIPGRVMHFFFVKRGGGMG